MKKVLESCTYEELINFNMPIRFPMRAIIEVPTSYINDDQNITTSNGSTDNLKYKATIFRTNQSSFIIASSGETGTKFRINNDRLSTGFDAWTGNSSIGGMILTSIDGQSSLEGMQVHLVLEGPEHIEYVMHKLEISDAASLILHDFNEYAGLLPSLIHRSRYLESSRLNNEYLYGGIPVISELICLYYLELLREDGLSNQQFTLGYDTHVTGHITLNNADYNRGLLFDIIRNLYTGVYDGENTTSTYFGRQTEHTSNIDVRNTVATNNDLLARVNTFVSSYQNSLNSFNSDVAETLDTNLNSQLNLESNDNGMINVEGFTNIENILEKSLHLGRTYNIKYNMSSTGFRRLYININKKNIYISLNDSLKNFYAPGEQIDYKGKTYYIPYIYGKYKDRIPAFYHLINEIKTEDSWNKQMKDAIPCIETGIGLYAIADLLMTYGSENIRNALDNYSLQK